MQPTIDSFQLLKDLILKLDAAQDLKSALGIVVQTICQQCKWSYGEAWQLDPQTNLLTNQATFHETDSDHSNRWISLYIQRLQPV